MRILKFNTRTNVNAFYAILIVAVSNPLDREDAESGLKSVAPRGALQKDLQIEHEFFDNVY